MIKRMRDAFDLNNDGKLDAMETAIAYNALFGSDQEEQDDEEEEFLDDLDAIEEDW